MYIYKFPFLCFAHNQFLHGVLANLENFYRPIDRQTDTVRYRSSLPELKKFHVNLVFYSFVGQKSTEGWGNKFELTNPLESDNSRVSLLTLLKSIKVIKELSL